MIRADVLTDDIHHSLPNTKTSRKNSKQNIKEGTNKLQPI